MDCWEEITAMVWDGDAVVWRQNQPTARLAFREAWSFVEEEWAERARPLTVVVSVGSDERPRTTLTVRSQLAPRLVQTRCVCPDCGWDEARMCRRGIKLQDEFGLMAESPLEQLVSDGPRTISAEWVEVRCAMCPELDAAGLDRRTKLPL
jgi:hypothetical protein